MEANNTQIKAALNTSLAVAEAIREVGEIPSGHLYAQVMQHLTLDTYEAIIKILVNGGLVKKQNHLLTWIGPKTNEKQ